LLKFLKVPFLNKDASKYFSTVINETIKAREDQNIIRGDLLQLMLEARNENKTHNGLSERGKSKGVIKISNAEIASQAMIFFFAGFDTVSTAMCFGSYEMAINKDIQDRLREEIMETHKDGKVTYETLMQMKYMDMVVSETLRKWPPFPNIDRLCTKPYTIEPTNEDEKPVPILLNQQVWIPIYGIQRDPKYFPNPEKFDPERFSDENKNNIVPYTYNPFGIGPRICIGNRFALLEIKALFFNLLLNYEIVPTKKTPIPLVLSKDFSQIPEDALWLGLKRVRT
jgi:cytochrome P450 family 9